MEKETKVIKEKVNTETSAAKIERVAAAKVHEEIGEELSPLKSQLSAIQSALNNLESSGQQNMNSSVGINNNQINFYNKCRILVHKLNSNNTKLINNSNKRFIKQRKC